METEKDSRLVFLDVLVTRRTNQLEHQVYRKPTHTDRYGAKILTIIVGRKGIVPPKPCGTSKRLLGAGDKTSQLATRARENCPPATSASGKGLFALHKQNIAKDEHHNRL